MKTIHAFHSRVAFRMGNLRVALNVSWVLAIPFGLWLVQGYYLPILGGTLSPSQAWISGFLIILSVGLSLLVHVLGHIFAARAFKAVIPGRINLSLLGDAAQAWPEPALPRDEAFIALAGPVSNLALAGLVYLVWNAQLNGVLNAVTLFALVLNLWLFAANLAPAYPMDGGRFLKAVIWEVDGRPIRAARIGLRLGWIFSVGLAGWAAYLLLQHARFSWATAGITVAFGLLMILGLTVRASGDESAGGESEVPAEAAGLGEMLIAGLTILCQVAVAFSLILTNDGLEAPGAALSVEPMVRIPTEYLHPSDGTFILTSVLVQTPITAGEWLIGKLNPVVKIVPPEIIVPENTTPQEQARQGFAMLDESETTAIVVGMRRAGFNADLVGKGIEVVDLQSDSRAIGVLQPGDIITQLNGVSVLTPSDLVDQVQAQTGQGSVRLTIERQGDQQEIDVPLIAPTPPGDSPRIGIVIQPAGFDLNLPFPVEIHSQKIVGGPSAGLMFTLTVYNLLTPQDLTGGRRIAGTGTIAMDGTVGPIGGVEQKVAAAEAAGAAYFLCPAENYDDAVAVARGIQVVRIETVEQALTFLEGLGAE